MSVNDEAKSAWTHVKDTWNFVHGEMYHWLDHAKTAAYALAGLALAVLAIKVGTHF